MENLRHVNFPKSTEKARKPQIAITIDHCDMLWNSLSLLWNTEHGSLSVNFHPIMFPNGFLSWCALVHSVKTCRLGEITPHGLDFAAAPVIRIVDPQKKLELKSRKRVENKSLQHLCYRGGPFPSLSCVFSIYLQKESDLADMTAIHFDPSRPRPTGVPPKEMRCSIEDLVSDVLSSIVARFPNQTCTDTSSIDYTKTTLWKVT